MFRRRGLFAVVLASLLAACDPTFELEVMNLQGPTVRVFVNGEEKGTLECRMGKLGLRPILNAPPLPWRIEFQRLDGEAFFDPIEIDGRGGGSQKLIVLEVGFVTDPPIAIDTLRPFELMPCPP